MTLPQNPTPGVLYNLRPHGGLNGDRKLLSSTSDGRQVNLWTGDDNSGRQKWKFVPRGDGTYNIMIYRGVDDGRSYLSCNSDGGAVDMWSGDDSSGRQQWVLTPLENGALRIEIKGGVRGLRKYLSTRAGGDACDLWSVDDNTGRQQWVLIPEDIEAERIEFQLDQGLVIPQPSFVASQTVTNDTSEKQSSKITFSQKATEKSSFQQQDGFKFKIGAEKSFGVPGFVSGKISVEMSTTHTWTYGKEETKEDTRTYELPVTVAPHTRVVAQATVTLTKMDVPYKVTGSSKLTGQTITVTGRWTGISAGAITYSLGETKLP